MSRQQSRDHLQDSIDAANALILLSEKPLKMDASHKNLLTRQQREAAAAQSLLLLSKEPPNVDKDVIDGAMVLLALSQQQQQRQNYHQYHHQHQQHQLDTEQMTIFEATDEHTTSFEEYRQKALENLRAASGGHIVKSNPNMRRYVFGSNAPDDTESTKYERYKTIRSKNNESAKKSRDRQKIRRIENQIKVDYYKNDNERCVAQLANTRDRIQSLKVEVKLAMEHLMSHDDDFAEVVVGPMHWLFN